MVLLQIVLAVWFSFLTVACLTYCVDNAHHMSTYENKQLFLFMCIWISNVIMTGFGTIVHFDSH